MSHVFISYAHEDYNMARAIAEALRQNKLPVWWDERIEPGERFTRKIQDALNSAFAVVVLWSESSLESEWVFKEAEIAEEKGTFVPVLLDGVWPPDEFGDVDAADLTRWNPRRPSREFDSLLRKLHILAGSSGEAAWSVERIGHAKLLVALDTERHTIEYAGGRAHLDGTQLSHEPNPLSSVRSFPFDLTDGAESFSSKLDVKVSAFKGSVKRLTLTVGGRVIYDG